MLVEPPAAVPVGKARGSAGLLPWLIVSEELVPPFGSGSGGRTPAPPPPLSLLELARISAPTIFIHQALVFEHALDAVRLREALAHALALYPTLACRATKGEDDEWVLCQPVAGALLTLGSSTVPTSRLAPRPPLPPAAPMAALGEELFGHLPSLPSLPQASALPLAHVALVTTLDGGCLLGLRVSHLLADFGTLRGLLHHLSREYNGRPLAPADVPAPAQPLVAALAAMPPPPGARLQNYLPLPPSIGERLAALAAQPPLQGLTLHVPPARLAELKEQAAAEAAAAVEAGEEAWVSTNAALMAWLWRTLGALPCRRGAVVPFHQALDMRRRLPKAVLAACGGQGAAPRWLYGDLVASALAPALDAAAKPLGSVALHLRRAVARDAERFGTDVALLATDGASVTAPAIMRSVLEVIMERAAGRPTLIMTSQLTLDYDADASFSGHLPVGVVCTFGRVLVPVVHVQPAPPAAGGGVLLYCWLPPDEARELTAAVGATAAVPQPLAT